jgi:hypothetical protein
MSFCADGAENVTFGAALPVRSTVTEVTFSRMISEVQFVQMFPKSEEKRFRRSRVLMEMPSCIG